MKHLVLGVSGSVAAYRAADLAREAMRRGWIVRTLLTDAAAQFVSPALFEALTGQPCLSGVFEEPERGRMAHIDWGRWADAVMIAPATANTINRLGFGLGEDMLTTLALVTRAPLILAPAMNPSMYAHPTTQEALARLTTRGARIVEPSEGDVACGETGPGKLAPIETLLDALEAATVHSRTLEGKTLLLTSGPTREPIDAVRFLSNRSSGKMGAALAQAALQRGANVRVVSGPGSAVFPPEVPVTRAQTALEMLEAAREQARGADWLIGAAAVADYRPANPFPGKMRRESERLDLELVANPDIIATLRKEFPSARVVGFAAEPDGSLQTAVDKLARKGLDALAVNDVGAPGLGFDSDRNALTLLLPGREPEKSGERTKLACAGWLLDQLTERF